MGRQQRWVYHIEPSSFPPDFPERLEAFTAAAGLTWRGLSRRLKLHPRSVRRWRRGTRPESGHFVALVNLAAELGFLQLLLPEVIRETEETSAASGQ